MNEPGARGCSCSGSSQKDNGAVTGERETLSQIRKQISRDRVPCVVESNPSFQLTVPRDSGNHFLQHPAIYPQSMFSA